MDETTKQFLILIYFSIGLIIAAIIMWFNELNLKDDAHLTVLLLNAVSIAAMWGFFVLVAVLLIPINWLSIKTPFKQIGAWQKDQYND